MTASPPERTHLSIREVLEILVEEFPDVSISKIRYFESRGLIRPERTPAGYRRFYQPDVDRLRWILRQQRDNYLPLEVIRGRLEQDTPYTPSLFEASGPDDDPVPGAEQRLFGRGRGLAGGLLAGGGERAEGLLTPQRGVPPVEELPGLAAHASVPELRVGALLGAAAEGSRHAVTVATPGAERAHSGGDNGTRAYRNGALGREEAELVGNHSGERLGAGPARRRGGGDDAGLGSSRGASDVAALCDGPRMQGRPGPGGGSSLPGDIEPPESAGLTASARSAAGLDAATGRAAAAEPVGAPEIDGGAALLPEADPCRDGSNSARVPLGGGRAPAVRTEGTAGRWSARLPPPEGAEPEGAAPEQDGPEQDGPEQDGPEQDEEMVPARAAAAAVGAPGLDALGVVGSRRASPGLASPGLASPGLASPGLASPGLASPRSPSSRSASSRSASPRSASPRSASAPASGAPGDPGRGVHARGSTAEHAALAETARSDRLRAGGSLGGEAVAAVGRSGSPDGSGHDAGRPRAGALDQPAEHASDRTATVAPEGAATRAGQPGRADTPAREGGSAARHPGPAPSSSATPPAAGAHSATEAATIPVEVGPMVLAVGRGAHRVVTGASFSEEELAVAAGVEPAVVAELLDYGLISGRDVAGVRVFDEDALLVARVAVAFRRFGIEGRHLKSLKHAAEREAGLYAQVVTPLLRQRNPQSHGRAVSDLAEMSELGASLRAHFLQSELRQLTGG